MEEKERREKMNKGGGGGEWQWWRWSRCRRGDGIGGGGGGVEVDGNGGVVKELFVLFNYGKSTILVLIFFCELRFLCLNFLSLGFSLPLLLTVKIVYEFRF